MSDKERDNDTDESISDWTLLNEEEEEEGENEEENEEEGAIGPPRRREREQEQEQTTEQEQPEEEEEEQESSEQGSKVEELKECESSDIETLDYIDEDPPHYVMVNNEGMIRLSVQNLRFHNYETTSFMDDVEADAESLSSDSPEEKVRKRRSRKSEATQDEETDLSLASSPSLPDDLPAIKPEPQYIHTPDQELNTRLNLIVALTLACVIGLGLGHFLGLVDLSGGSAPGWSSRTLWEENMNAVQVRKLRELQDNLLSCMSSMPVTTQSDRPNDNIHPSDNFPKSEYTHSQLPLSGDEKIPSSVPHNTIEPLPSTIIPSHDCEDHASCNDEPVFEESLIPITATATFSGKIITNPLVEHFIEPLEDTGIILDASEIHSANYESQFERFNNKDDIEPISKNLMGEGKDDLFEEESDSLFTAEDSDEDTDSLFAIKDFEGERDSNNERQYLKLTKNIHLPEESSFDYVNSEETTYEDIFLKDDLSIKNPMDKNIIESISIQSSFHENNREFSNYYDNEPFVNTLYENDPNSGEDDLIPSDQSEIYEDEFTSYSGGYHGDANSFYETSNDEDNSGFRGNSDYETLYDNVLTTDSKIDNRRILNTIDVAFDNDDIRYHYTNLDDDHIPEFLTKYREQNAMHDSDLLMNNKNEFTHDKNDLSMNDQNNKFTDYKNNLLMNIQKEFTDDKNDLLIDYQENMFGDDMHDDSSDLLKDYRESAFDDDYDAIVIPVGNNMESFKDNLPSHSKVIYRVDNTKEWTRDVNNWHNDDDSKLVRSYDSLYDEKWSLNDDDKFWSRDDDNLKFLSLDSKDTFYDEKSWSYDDYSKTRSIVDEEKRFFNYDSPTSNLDDEDDDVKYWNYINGVSKDYDPTNYYKSPNGLSSPNVEIEQLIMEDLTHDNSIHEDTPKIVLHDFEEQFYEANDYLVYPYRPTSYDGDYLSDRSSLELVENKTFADMRMGTICERSGISCAALGVLSLQPPSSCIELTPILSLILHLPQIVERLQMENEELRDTILDLQSNIEPIKIKGKEGKESRELREKINQLISDNEEMRLAIARVQYNALPDAHDRTLFNKVVQENHHLRTSVSKLTHLGPNIDKLKASLELLEEQNKDLVANVAKIRYEQPFPRELKPVVKEMEGLKQAILAEAHKKKPTSSTLQNAKSYLLYMSQILNAFGSLHNEDVGIVDKVDLVKDVFTLMVPKGTKLPESAQEKVICGRNKFKDIKDSLQKKWLQLKELTKTEKIAEIGQATVSKMNRVIVNVVNKMKDIGYMTIMKQNKKPVDLVVTSLAEKMDILDDQFNKTWNSLQAEVAIPEEDKKEIFGEDYVNSPGNHGNKNYDAASEAGNSDEEEDENPLLVGAKGSSLSSKVESKPKEEVKRQMEENKQKKIELKKQMLMKEEEQKKKNELKRQEKKKEEKKKIEKETKEEKNKFQVKENTKNKSPETDDAKYYKGQYNKYKEGDSSEKRYRDDDDDDWSKRKESKTGLKRHWEKPQNSKNLNKEQNVPKKQFIRRKGKKSTNGESREGGDAITAANFQLMDKADNYQYKNYVKAEKYYDKRFGKHNAERMANEGSRKNKQKENKDNNFQEVDEKIKRGKKLKEKRYLHDINIDSEKYNNWKPEISSVKNGSNHNAKWEKRSNYRGEFKKNTDLNKKNTLKEMDDKRGDKFEGKIIYKNETNIKKDKIVKPKKLYNELVKSNEKGETDNPYKKKDKSLVTHKINKNYEHKKKIKPLENDKINKNYEQKKKDKPLEPDETNKKKDKISEMEKTNENKKKDKPLETDGDNKKLSENKPDENRKNAEHKTNEKLDAEKANQLKPLENDGNKRIEKEKTNKLKFKNKNDKFKTNKPKNKDDVDKNYTDNIKHGKEFKNKKENSKKESVKRTKENETTKKYKLKEHENVKEKLDTNYEKLNKNEVEFNKQDGNQENDSKKETDKYSTKEKFNKNPAHKYQESKGDKRKYDKKNYNLKNRKNINEKVKYQKMDKDSRKDYKMFSKQDKIDQKFRKRDKNDDELANPDKNDKKYTEDHNTDKKLKKRDKNDEEFTNPDKNDKKMRKQDKNSEEYKTNPGLTRHDQHLIKQDNRDGDTWMQTRKDVREKRRLAWKDLYEDESWLVRRGKGRSKKMKYKEEDQSWMEKRGIGREKERRRERISDWVFDRSRMREQNRREEPNYYHRENHYNQDKPHYYQDNPHYYQDNPHYERNGYHYDKHEKFHYHDRYNGPHFRNR